MPTWRRRTRSGWPIWSAAVRASCSGAREAAWAPPPGDAAGPGRPRVPLAIRRGGWQDRERPPLLRAGGLRVTHPVSRSVALLALVAGLLALPACSRPKPPNILLIVIDTLRADRLGVYGSITGLTPFIDQVAARGTVFKNAYAPSSWTCP